MGQEGYAEFAVAKYAGNLGLLGFLPMVHEED